MRLFLFLSIALFAAGCGAQPDSANINSAANGNKAPISNKSTNVVPTSGYEIVKAYPHDPKAFTQGLDYRDGFLYESTGEYGASTLRKVELETGKIVQKHDLAREIFAEGMTMLGDTIYQVTWRNGTAFVYDVNDFRLLRELRYTGEGWGLTDDGTNLIMSDGTHILRFIDPETFKVVRSVPVLQDNGKPLFLLNELEYVKGEIWANIWHSEETSTSTTQGQMPNIGKPNHIARVDPASGKLLGWIDLGGISPEDQNDYEKSENTLNGIAYDESGDRIFVTGKNWKRLYEIKLSQK